MKAVRESDFRIPAALQNIGTITFIHPDYVFESYYDGSSEFNKNYALPTFVKANKHLSVVQSRADVDAVGRWNVSENIRTYQEKV